MMDINAFVSFLYTNKEKSNKLIKPKEFDKQISMLYNLLNSDDANNTNIANLEHAGYFENVLWPSFSESSKNEVILSILKIINYKISQKVNIWDFFSKEEKIFINLFDKVTNLNIQELSPSDRFIYVSFLINCFQSLEIGYISKLCSKLINLPIWLRLSKETMKESLLLHSKYIKNWKKVSQFASEIYITKECFFIHNLLDNFLQILEKDQLENNSNFLFYEKFMEFLIDLLSQLHYRKFLLPLLKDRHFSELCIISKLNKKNQHEGRLFSKLLEILKFYINFEINEENGEPISQITLLKHHYENINLMQSVAFQLFPEKLSRIYLKNISLIDNQQNINDMLDLLTYDEVFTFAKKLNLLRLTPNEYTKELIYQVFISHFERRQSVLEKVNSLPLYPTEKIIWDEDLIPDEFENNDNKVLPIPKLNLQFLTHYDYLLRNFNLFRLESTFQIRQDLDEVINMVHPKFDKKGNFEEFDGWARMAAPIKNFKILTIGTTDIGKNYPSEVIAEIEVNLQGVQTQIRNEWDQIKKHEVLICVNFDMKSDFYTNKGVQHVRGAEVISVQDQDNNVFNDFENAVKKRPTGTTRKIQVWLDPIQYKEDLSNKDLNIENVYSNFQLLIRKKPKESNFKSILETIRDLMNSITSIPKWLENVFLGYDNQNSSNYTKISNLKDFHKFDLKDTFLDLDHFTETVTNNENLDKIIRETPQPSFLVNPKDSLFMFNIASIDLIKKSETNNLNLKKNNIRFTKSQVEAIISGVNNGLSLIVGPPGTGKTDIAVQIISLILQNYPQQRTLIVTHSNQALNELFEKIIKLDVNERYLLRLGMGEKDLDSQNDFTTNGRVNFMLKRRLELLNEILMLALSIKVNTHQEYICESALNFYNFQIKSRISEYEKAIKNDTNKALIISEVFPFTTFFQNNHYKAETLFSGDYDSDLRKTKLFMKYIDNIFLEIEECYAFELLRNNVERGNYLLTKQSKIIAMTCTHAALKRKDFLKLNFEYDNILMEEAGQILEIETFIPLLLQKPKNDISRLKRVIMIGDNNQLPPIIKNNAFKIYGKMDQSMFSRFIRLQTPSIYLNYQGRSRPSIADLFRWRYKELFDLPCVSPVLNNTSSSTIIGAYTLANTGFINDYQFINVPEFEGKGETTPFPFFYQNLAEAEYIVATYMFMCLLGYNPKSITILTTYNGQKYLIKDIIQQKCSWHPLFQTPHKITTVDKYQGQQNDFVLLSLVRSRHIGHIRDIRRLIVAMSRARLGLYVFGRFEVYDNCYELRNTMNLFKQKSLNLEILLNDSYPTKRHIGDKQTGIKVQDFTHMYKIVQEIIKIQQTLKIQTNISKQKELNEKLAKQEKEKEDKVVDKVEEIEDNGHIEKNDEKMM